MKMIALFLISIILSGCSYYGKITVDTLGNTIAEDVMAEPKQKSEMMFGADITEDSAAGDIVDFEMKTAIQTLYADEIYITEAKKAEAFMLECTAEGKIPYIILKTQKELSSTDMKYYIDEMAEAIGKYQVPVYVEVFENNYCFKQEDVYTDYAVSSILAKNIYAKFGASIKADDVIVLEELANKEMDFVCVNGYFKSDNDVNRFFEEKAMTYALELPVIVRFGAESFSSSNCEYTTDQACKTIETMYDLAKKDDDIISVIYMDKTDKIANKIKYSDYYITSDKRIIDAYTKAVS